MIATALSALLLAGRSEAQEKKPDNEVSFNAAVTTDYRYRGLSQTRLKPALQGGADFVNNPSGFYAGVWGSTIKWIKDAGGDADVEIDLYAGKRGSLGEASYDVGVLRYEYPSNKLNPSASTTEVYAQVGLGPAYIKYSHAVTNLFGFADSKGSGYLDLGANLEAPGGYVFNLHVGRQKVDGNGAASYTDYKVGVTKDFGVVTGALAVIGTNAKESSYSSPVNGKFLGDTGVVLTISKTF
ncbi:MAG TPA: TorF family putative porin [Burkholderiaceae bacterium]